MITIHFLIQFHQNFHRYRCKNCLTHLVRLLWLKDRQGCRYWFCRGYRHQFWLCDGEWLCVDDRGHHDRREWTGRTASEWYSAVNDEPHSHSQMSIYCARVTLESPAGNNMTMLLSSTSRKKSIRI